MNSGGLRRARTADRIIDLGDNTRSSTIADNANNTAGMAKAIGMLSRRSHVGTFLDVPHHPVSETALVAVTPPA